MCNQIEAANRLKLRAETISSTNFDNWHAVRQRLNDEIDLLLISPERLVNDDGFVTHNDFVVKGLNACVSGKTSTEAVFAEIMRRHVTLRENDHHAKPARDF